jgi:MFS family permease
MISYDLFFYAWLIIIAIPLGSFIGLTAGWLIGKLPHERKRGILNVLVDGVAGILGFVLGAYLSAIDSSVSESWENGKLVSRATTGYADYIFLFAIVGAITMVSVFHLGKAIIKNLPCKKDLKDKPQHPINAV